MLRVILSGLGGLLVFGFVIFLFWPSGNPREPIGTLPEGTAVFEDIDIDSYQGDARAGQSFAQEFCSRCHQVGTVGESPVAEAPPFRTFESRWPLEFLDEALAEGIMVGHPEHQMPVFQLDPQQIADLSAYLDEIGE